MNNQKNSLLLKEFRTFDKNKQGNIIFNEISCRFSGVEKIALELCIAEYIEQLESKDIKNQFKIIDELVINYMKNLNS